MTDHHNIVPMQFPSDLRVGLALGSGGVRGFAHLGVLEVLEREGVPIHAIAGSSAGAAIGAMYAFRPKLAPNLTHVRRYLQSELYDTTKLDYLRRSEESRQNLYEKLRVRFAKGAVFATSLTRPSLFDMHVLRDNVRFLVPPVNIEDAFIPFAAVAFDLENGDEIVFDRGPLPEAVMASCAIPGVFPAVEHEGRKLMDGGIVNPVPVEPVRNLGANFVLAVDVTPTIEPLSGAVGSYELAMRAADISRYRLKALLLEQADLVIPIDTADVFWADFDRFEDCVERGRQAARAAIPAIRRALNERRGAIG